MSQKHLISQLHLKTQALLSTLSQSADSANEGPSTYVLFSASYCEVFTANFRTRRYKTLHLQTVQNNLKDRDAIKNQSQRDSLWYRMHATHTLSSVPKDGVI